MKRVFSLSFAALFVALAATSALAAVRAPRPRVLIIVTSADRFPSGQPTGMWLEEYATPYEMMLKQGYQITVASPKGGESPIDPRSAARGEQAALWADALKAHLDTVKLSTLRAEDFDAVFIPGGHGPLFDLATDPVSIALLDGFARTGKPIASVCHGPAALAGVTLANGDPLVKGKRVAAFSDSEEHGGEVPFSVQQRLIALGGRYSQGPDYQPYALEDGALILGQNPASSAQVAQMLIDQLEK